jgi:NAD+ synthase
MDSKELSDKLVLWIKERVLSAGLKGAVFGMSGGIDSSLIAVLSKKAFENSSLGLVMPCHSIEQDEQHAMAVASKFAIKTRKIALDSLYDSVIQIMSGVLESPLSKLTQANIKARLRMITLYAHANQLGFMVIGSGNKRNWFRFFFQYGDSGVDFLPWEPVKGGQRMAVYLEFP